MNSETENVLQKIDLLNKINDNAPASGRYAIYFRKGVKYEKYENISNVMKIVNENNDKLLEIHCFDEICEVRGVYSERKKGYIYCKVQGTKEDIKNKEKYMCEIVKDINDNDLMLVNYIDYDDNGMIQIHNYRMAVPIEGGSK